jgi:hypothetical protein
VIKRKSDYMQNMGDMKKTLQTKEKVITETYGASENCSAPEKGKRSEKKKLDVGVKRHNWDL